MYTRTHGRLHLYIYMDTLLVLAMYKKGNLWGENLASFFRIISTNNNIFY